MNNTLEKAVLFCTETVGATTFCSNTLKMYVSLNITDRNFRHPNFILFQENTQNPSNIILLDWQMSRYGPPIIDIFYFLLSTTDKSFRDKHFTDLLNEYHSMLSTSIEKLGSDAERIYSLSKFQSDLVRFNRFPLIFAVASVMFRLADEKHILDLDEFAERICKGERPNLILQFDPDTNEQYRKALNDAVSDVVRYCGVN